MPRQCCVCPWAGSMEAPLCLSQSWLAGEFPGQPSGRAKLDAAAWLAGAHMHPACDSSQLTPAPFRSAHSEIIMAQCDTATLSPPHQASTAPAFTQHPLPISSHLCLLLLPVSTIPDAATNSPAEESGSHLNSPHQLPLTLLT